MVFLWFSYGFPMVFLWFSYGFPMVFLWFSYGFPMVCGGSIESIELLHRFSKRRTVSSPVKPFGPHPRADLGNLAVESSHTDTQMVP